MRRAVRAIIFKGNDLLVMKRNKFGTAYATLPGGGMSIGETAPQALAREMEEETGLRLGDARLVFIEEAGEPYGTQYIYLVDYVSGEPRLDPNSGEAQIAKLGQNLYDPTWLPMSELAGSSFVSERLKQAIIKGVQQGFPQQAVTI